ncbi:hypothetical protein ASPZODRAFT_138155 [Penicilliopsis zonata CBS 506.65]|uniref:Rho-GAP domain-containing protein n=1 Tax=Penicilliopsis zonata CBS 506.65 TaxID=1073090 RepID=A0A1L9SUY0_9EURO|nr:hypothetical protein ASPZODRAFT_138155 [Penicilliopsis zonata CBS 506.65]OJJ51032.1 hypothetical protein ASPZODRAFT_138155 [Penicilliopsis zonata CBS 506.65]
MVSFFSLKTRRSKKSRTRLSRSLFGYSQADETPVDGGQGPGITPNNTTVPEDLFGIPGRAVTAKVVGNVEAALLDEKTGRRKLKALFSRQSSKSTGHFREASHQAEPQSAVEGSIAGSVSRVKQQVSVRELQSLVRQTMQPGSESRKVSDKSVASVHSNSTSATVHRHQSKYTSDPVDVALDVNPFANEVENQNNNPSAALRDSEVPSQSDYGSRETPDPELRDISDGPAIQPQSTPFLSKHEGLRYVNSVTKDGVCQEALLEKSNGASCFDYRRAVVGYNKLAFQFNLRPLQLQQDVHAVSDKSRVNHEERPFGYRERLYGKMRTVRSTMGLRAVNPVRSEPVLQHRKTFASLSSRVNSMDSLQGKSVETLARLGGHCFLDLPLDFAPTTLRLPACFAETAWFLKNFATKARGLFFDHGDLRVAIRLYEHFAGQVLEAEKEQGIIQMTTRGNSLTQVLDDLNPSCPRKRYNQILSVGYVFQSLLAGLPAGILGSPELYQVLLDIYFRCFSGAELVGSRTGLAGLTQASAGKIQAIALATIALTSPMQFQLICAVFGLCAVLLHETKRLFELDKLARGIDLPSTRLVAGLPDLERLGQVFGPLLMNGADEGGGSPRRRGGNQLSSNESEDILAAAQREVDGARVARMLIENWHAVSRQVRVWGGYQYPVNRLSVPYLVDS